MHFITRQKLELYPRTLFKHKVTTFRDLDVQLREIMYAFPGRCNTLTLALSRRVFK